ncbi:MAG: hypothetical protein JWL77_705, partial [Chthonomonadaceae bacterium]|nr:hypothetical protein [Chthonomonadaceae bacterium]
TTHLKATTLPDTLKELSRLTGVRLESSEDTADLKVTMFVENLPLDTVRARLAETLHLTWMQHETKKDQPASYLIYRSSRNKEEEMELSTRGERAFRKGIEDAIGALSLAPEARAKLFADHPNLERTFAQPGGEAAVTILSQIPPDLRTSIMDGNKLEFPSSKPPPELASHFDAIMKNMKADHTDPIQTAMFGQEGKFSVTRTGEGAGSLIGIAFSVESETVSGTMGYSVKGVSEDEVYLGAYAPNHTGAGYADAHRPVAVPAALTAKSFDDLLEKVADTLHINWIGESYRQVILPNPKGEIVYPLSVKAGATTIAQALDDIVWQDYWWKQGSVYMFQRPLWWKNRRSDILDAKLAYLAKVLERQPISFEDAAEVCKTLSAEQWGWLTTFHDRDSLSLTPVQFVMRFYGHLTPFRKTDLFLNGGTEMSILETADQQRLRTWIAETGKEALQQVRNMPGKIYIMAMREPRNAKRGPVRFRAVFQAGNGTTIPLREQTVPDGDPDLRQRAAQQ